MELTKHIPIIIDTCIIIGVLFFLGYMVLYGYLFMWVITHA